VPVLGRWAAAATLLAATAAVVAGLLAEPSWVPSPPPPCSPAAEGIGAVRPSRLVRRGFVRILRPLPFVDMDMRHRLATLFVDIAGSTRLVVRHAPETVLAVVQCFAELVADIALAHRGRVKDFEGDGVLVYFDTASAAAEAAVAIRAQLDREQCDTGCGGGPGASIRMALTVGDVAVGPVGPPGQRALALVGASVNLGARLLRALPPGGIVASGDVVAALQTEAPWLARRFALVDSGYTVAGGDGLTVAVYALDDGRRTPARSATIPV
jgi:class 3 adenylate cyclase